MSGISYDRCPNAAQMGAGVARYIEEGCESGGFLFALFSGDLFEACARADPGNLYALVAWFYWVRDHAPSGCYGSTAKVEKWMTAGGLRGLGRTEATG